VVVVDKFSNSPLFDGGGQSVDGNEQIKDNGVATKESREGSAYDDVIIEGFDKEWRYPTKKP
jgi:hypothetical protein